MRFPAFRLSPLPLVALLMIQGSPALGRVVLLSSDERGVLLRLEVPSYQLGAADRDRRTPLNVEGLNTYGIPGRPQIPFASTLIGLPPGARPVARVVASDPEELRQDVRLPIALKPGFRDDGGHLGVIPTLDVVPAILDGPWPRSPVEVGDPFTLRRRRVVSIRLQPFRYDAASQRLWGHRSLTVRVDFVGGSARGMGIEPTTERHWEPVLRGTILNYEAARPWREPSGGRVPPPVGSALARSLPRGAKASAFDESAPEVRIKIDSTGVYALPFGLLRSHGYPTGVPVGEVSLHRHEYVEGGDPPYVTIELPIEVDDVNGNGVFDVGDRIVAFIQSWAERSRASLAQRNWGDAEVVYATQIRGGSGLRMSTRPGWHDLTLTPLASYPWTQHWEKNLYYIPVFRLITPCGSDTASDQFTWTDLRRAYSLPDSFRFEANDLDTTQRVTFTAVWQGTRDNNHISWAQLRNGSNQFTSVADSVNWSGRCALIRSQTLFGSSLTEGPTNVLRVWGKTGANDPYPTAVIDAAFNYFETTYWRRFQALNGYLAASSAGVTGDFEIRAGNFGSRAIRVYDVSDSLNPVRLQVADSLIVPAGSRFAVRFQDTGASGETRRYVAFDTPKPVPPDHYTTVTRQNLYAQGSGDYLLIVPEAFLPAVGRLDSLHRAQGLHVVVAPLEAVNNEFNGGRHSSYSIRRFVRYAYDHWNAQFVLLVGDGTADPMNYTGTAGQEWIPAQMIAGPVGVFDNVSTVNEAIPSDPWYVWCVDCTTPDQFREGNLNKVQDLFIGRLPVNSLQQATDVVNKVVNYEYVTPDQSWRRDMLLVTDDAYSTTSFFGGNPGAPQYCKKDYEEVFRDITNALRSVVIDEAGLVQSNVEIFDLDYYLHSVPVTVVGGDSCRGTGDHVGDVVAWNNTQTFCHLSVTPQLIQKLNAGKLWWNFQGHANQYVLTHEDLYVNRGPEDDKDLLMNDGKPFLFSGFSCHPNGFATAVEGDPNRGPALGEEMVTLPNKGAIASWASSGFEILPSTFSATTHLNVSFARALFADSVRDESLGDKGARVVLGEAAAKALLDNLGQTSGFGLEHDVAVSYQLLGDPATRLSIGAAQTTMTANDLPVTDGQPVRLHTPGDTLRLVADIASNVEIKSISLERKIGTGATEVIPDTSYALTPAFPDTTSPGIGGRRYHLVYHTHLTSNTTRYTFHALDRYGLAGQAIAPFDFQTVLKADGVPLREGDVVAPTASLTLQVISPSPINPATDLTLTLKGASQPFTFVPAPGDTSAREWVLTLTHPAFGVDTYDLQLTSTGGAVSTHRFRVETSGNELVIRDALAFPNPFDDELGTHFSFTLVSGSPVDLLLRVYTVNGRLVYERKEQGLVPGYQQLAWDGRDAERDKLANGIYVYRMVAKNSKTTAFHEGRLVKLRKPRRVTITSP